MQEFPTEISHLALQRVLLHFIDFIITGHEVGFQWFFHALARHFYENASGIGKTMENHPCELHPFGSPLKNG
jgi:hypothetical protein